MTALYEALQRIGGQRVLVVGDVMLDRYIFGKADRLSPEAPVPVVQIAAAVKPTPGAAGLLQPGLP